MDYQRKKCLAKTDLGQDCPAMACPSGTGYCSYHDLQRTPVGQRPKPDQPVVPKPKVSPAPMRAYAAYLNLNARKEAVQ